MSAPRSQRTSFADAVALIAAESSVWVRVAAILRDEGTWDTRLLELTSGAAPPGWSPMAWDYPWALFAATQLTGEAVAPSLFAVMVALGKERTVARLKKANALAA